MVLNPRISVIAYEASVLVMNIMFIVPFMSARHTPGRVVSIRHVRAEQRAFDSR